MRATLHSCTPNAVLVVLGDLPTGATEYLQQVNHERLDVTLLVPGLIGAPWYQQRLPENLKKAAQGAPRGHDPALLAVLKAQKEAGRDIFFNRAHTTPGEFLNRGLVWEWQPRTHPADARGFNHEAL